ncbi:MAG: tyrosine-type recombinase/integrase [bacterium]
MRLTKTAIDKAKPQDKPYILWDDLVSGFGVKVYKTGRKSFIIDYRHQGKQRRMVVGRYGYHGLSEARKIAKRKLTDVLNAEDPLDTKNRAKCGDTIDDLFSVYLDNHAKERKRSWFEDERRYKKHIGPVFGKKRIETLTRADVAKWHSEIGRHHKRESNNCLALLSVMFTYAERNGHVPEGHFNPCAGIRKFKEGKRDRWLKPPELPALAAAIDREPNLYLRAFFWLALLTGCRKSELLTAQWKYIDLDRAELKLPQTKAGRVHYVPLSEPAIQILRDLPRQQGNPFILCGHRAGDHLKNINRSWHRIREEAGVPDLNVHDLRRTFGSWLASSGHSLQMIGNLLGHSDPRTTQIYSRLASDPLAEVVRDYGEKIVEFSKLKKQVEGKAS